MDGNGPGGRDGDLPAMAVGERRRLTEAEITRFDLVAPSTARRARLVVVPFLTPGAGGMTLGRWILLRRGQEHRAELVAHELVHVEQFGDLRSGRFFRRYLRHYLRSRVAGLAHRLAYLAIPAEAEARERTEQWKARQAAV